MFFCYSIISAAKESLDVVKPRLELSIEQILFCDYDKALI